MYVDSIYPNYWKSKTPQSALHLLCIFKYIIEIGYQRQINDSTLSQTGRFQFLHASSTVLTYVAIFQYHLHILCSYITADSVCNSIFDIRLVCFNSRQFADKEVDVTRVSTVSLTDSFPQIVRSLQRFNLPVQHSIRPNAV
jgi:hypothetical protein